MTVFTEIQTSKAKKSVNHGNYASNGFNGTKKSDE